MGYQGMIAGPLDGAVWTTGVSARPRHVGTVLHLESLGFRAPADEDRLHQPVQVDGPFPMVDARQAVALDVPDRLAQFARVLQCLVELGGYRCVARAREQVAPDG